MASAASKTPDQSTARATNVRSQRTVLFRVEPPIFFQQVCVPLAKPPLVQDCHNHRGWLSRRNVGNRSDASAPGAVVRAAAACKEPYNPDEHECRYSKGLRSVSPWYREADPIAGGVAAARKEWLGV